DHESWGGELPHKKWVDDGTKVNPLFLYRTDGHIGFANSVALKFAGITKDTPDPEGGIIIRDENGEPTGTLIDNAMYLVSKLYPNPTDEKIDEMFDAGMTEALMNGVTQVHSVDMAVWDNLKIYNRAKAENRLKIRTYYFSHISKRHELAAMIARDGTGDDFLRFGGVKVMADGALGSGTAWFHEGYSDEPDNSGFPIWSMDELKVMVQESHDYGFQLAIHAIGDKANDEVLDIIEAVGAKNSRARIEHAQHVKKSTVKRFNELGVIAAVHPYHVYDDGRFAQKRIGSERVKEIYAFNSLFESGAKVTFGSDWFVAPLKPLMGIYVAVTRHTADGKNPDGWVPEEKVTVEQAVRAYTINGAYGGKQEDKLGSIEAGKLADIIVLSDNIFEIDPAEIKDTRVEMTIIGGEILYKAE
ncbi:MAG: amidohydrolase, partial [Emcibacteraceae bacterium]|nr:amidohydrolase [Emcibacteraceae bacterium]